MSEIKCLDHGFVRLVDHMGNDEAIVEAARVSYAGAEKPTVRDTTSLINYLVEHRHTSPLEQVVFKFHIKMPIFVARQHIRHRTARLNEYSGRYSEMKDECYTPKVDRLTVQSKTNKQGSGTEQIENAEYWLNLMAQEQGESHQKYHDYLEAGLSKELARINLPLSTYTEMYWQMDLHNLLHYIGLRIDSHAQEEIRVYGQAMLDLIEPIVPIAVQAYRTHVLESVKFSGEEIKVLRNLLRTYKIHGIQDSLQAAFDHDESIADWSTRKQDAFVKKLGLN